MEALAGELLASDSVFAFASGSGYPHRIMEGISEVVADTGILKGKHRRAVDSTVLDDAVAMQVPDAGPRRSRPGSPGPQRCGIHPERLTDPAERAGPGRRFFSGINGRPRCALPQLDRLLPLGWHGNHPSG